MATTAVDPKAAPLADDLKELALSLPATAFPKNLFCALCNQLAIDSYKLLCCNKAICSSCQTTIQFPTTCQSCDHSPLEADSCTPNKALRNTMRVWLQKQKKKEEAKAAAQVATPPVEASSAAPEVQPAGESAEKPVESVEEAPAAGDFIAQPDTGAGAADNADAIAQRAGSTSAQVNENINSPEIKLERRGSTMSQAVTQSIEPATAEGPSEEQSGGNGPNDNSANNSAMMNGMQGQMGYAFPNQAGFNNGMGWNGMPNMMANGNWNDFNNMNGMPNNMYGNFGGNMGMGMNDMSAMNMMNYGGGYGNGWNGMGGGYGNFNGSNQMGGFNQSGAYPDMMNQFPKNNFSNHNQNRFHANQGGQNSQRDRNGSRGSFGPSYQNAQSRPESQSGPAHNVRRFHPASPPKTSLSADQSTVPVTDDSVHKQRDGQSPDGPANAAPEVEVDVGQANASALDTEEGKTLAVGEDLARDSPAGQHETSGDISKDGAVDTDRAVEGSTEAAHSSGLNPIQTFDSGDAEMQNFDQSMMGTGMHPDMAYQMMNQVPHQQMNASFDRSMNMNMGYDHQNNFGSRGNINNGAYGAARVLVGQAPEPVGVGVAGAPTGPRAMREGRPNTGFSGRANNNRFPPAAPKSVASTHEPTSAGSPHQRVRSRSPLRDESLRVKQRSPERSRSRSKSPPREDIADEYRERSRSVDRGSRQDARGRSPTPKGDDDYEYRKERRHYRSSRHEDRDEEYEDRHRSDRDSRGDRTRDASADSKYRSSRRDKENYRSSRSHRDRSKDHRRRHRSQERYEDDETYAQADKDSDGSSRRKHRSSDKDKYRERERSRDKDRERDRKDRKDRDRDYEYEREKDRSREKDKDRRRRRDREAEEDEREYGDGKHRSSRRSRKDRDRESDREREQYDAEPREQSSRVQNEEDIVGQMMKKRAASPPLNAPTGPSANGFSIKGRSKNTVMPPPQPPTGPRAFQPPKGPAADRNKDRSESRDHRRKSSASSGHATPVAPITPQDHYAAERERHARERDGRERDGKAPRESSSHKSLHSRISSRPSISSKRSRDDVEDTHAPTAPKGPKADVKAPTGPASHRDKRRKSGTAGDDNIASLFTAGLRKNAKRRGGVRTEGDVEREMVERERERR